MKRLLGLFIVVGFVLAIPASQLAWGKGHVPAHKEQTCHKGEVIAVGARALTAHLDHGDAFINKRTLIPPKFTGDAC